jgi:hypothetical protein
MHIGEIFQLFRCQNLIVLLQKVLNLDYLFLFGICGIDLPQSFPKILPLILLKHLPLKIRPIELSFCLTINGHHNPLEQFIGQRFPILKLNIHELLNIDCLCDGDTVLPHGDVGFLVWLDFGLDCFYAAFLEAGLVLGDFGFKVGWLFCEDLPVYLALMLGLINFFEHVRYACF